MNTAVVGQVPGVLEAISGRPLSGGASMLLLRAPSAATMASAASAASATSVAPLSTTVIVRRQTRAARQVGDTWQVEAERHPQLDDDALLLRAISSRTSNQPMTQPMTQSLSKRVAVLSEADTSTPALLLPSSSLVELWWEWWRCTAKGYGPTSLTGNLRISRCCKPSDLLAGMGDLQRGKVVHLYKKSRRWRAAPEGVQQ